MTLSLDCKSLREQFSPYLDGMISGLEMQAIASHLGGCTVCSSEFAELRGMQESLASMGSVRAPVDLQRQLSSALAEERARGTNRSLPTRLAAAWKSTLAPLALRCAAGTAATLLLLGGVGAMMMAGPSAVEANDEPLGAVTAPHFLYSEVPPQAIQFGHEAPVLVEAKVDDQGRVYDYTIVSGPTDPRVEVSVQANLLSSVFKPATVFGVPVTGRVLMTYSGISVRG